MRAFIFSLIILSGNLISFHTFAQNSEDESSDSTVVVKKQKEKFEWSVRSIRVGTDALAHIRSAVNPNLSTWEGRFEADMKQYIGVVEFGQWNNRINRSDSTQNQAIPGTYDVYDYQVNGGYLRLGIDANFVHKSPEKSVFSFGIRYGRAWQSDNIAYGLDDPVWGLQQGIYAENPNVRAGWVEMMLGLQVRIHKNIVMGYTARLKFGLNYSQQDFVPFEIAGYGRSETITPNNQTWGFNYYLMYNLDLKD